MTSKLGMAKLGPSPFVLVAGDGGEVQEVGPYHRVAHLQRTNCTAQSVSSINLYLDPLERMCTLHIVQCTM